MSADLLQLARFWLLITSNCVDFRVKETEVPEEKPLQHRRYQLPRVRQRANSMYHAHVLSNFGIDIVHNETLLFHSSYSIMFQCWNANPEERPSFSALEQVISKMEMKHEVMSICKLYNTACDESQKVLYPYFYIGKEFN